MSFHMRKIWEHSKVFVCDVQDIFTYEYACGSSEATWDPSASFFLNLRSSIAQQSSIGFGRCAHQFLEVRHPHCCHSKASISFCKADSPIGVISFHTHLFIGLNFLVLNLYSWGSKRYQLLKSNIYKRRYARKSIWYLFASLLFFSPLLG